MTRIGLPAFLMLLTLLPGAAAAQTPPAGASEPSSALPPLEELRATRERPLFSPSRRPPDDPTSVDTPVVEESPDVLPYELTGVVLGADTAIAILRHRDTQETVQLHRGQALAAWSLEEIAPRHVVLRQEERQVRLELFTEKSESGGAPTPPILPPATMRPPPPPPQSRAEAPQRPKVQQSPPQRRPVRRGGQQPRRPQNP